MICSTFIAILLCFTITFGQYVRPFRSAPANHRPAIQFSFRGPLLASPVFVRNNINNNNKPPQFPLQWSKSLKPNEVTIRRFSHVIYNTNEPAAIKFIDQDDNILGEGDDCQHQYTNAAGICTLSRDCPEAFQMLRHKGVIPEICSYNVHEPLICCPRLQPRLNFVVDIVQAHVMKDNDVVAEITKNLPELQTDAVTNRIHERSMLRRISAIKCEEYNKLMSHTIKHLSLIGKPAVHKMEVPNCKPDSTSLIVGGEDATPGEFPHMAALGWLKDDQTISWNCGGTLISAYFILTAAHCAPSSSSPVLVRLGVSNLNQTTTQPHHPNDYEIEEIFKHPDHTDNKYYHDIAVIRLKRRVVFTESVRPACLWQGTNGAEIESVLATGWGQTEFMGESSPNLLKVSLNVVRPHDCNQFYKGLRKLDKGITQNQICAGTLKGGRDTCQGDSGGPIQIVSTDGTCSYHVVGVTSFGKFCAASKAPGIYTRVASYLDWIESIVWN